MPGQSANPNATVHFYRRALLAGATKPSVYCDGQDMAHVQSGRILTVEIPAGNHYFSADPKHGGFQLDTESGHEYFLRLDYTPNTSNIWRLYSVLSNVSEERGRIETANLKPLDAKWIGSPNCGAA